MNTYRAYQEDADRALTRLVSSTFPLPSAAVDVTRLLQLRHVCLGTLTERLDHISVRRHRARHRFELVHLVSAPTEALGSTIRTMTSDVSPDFSVAEVTDRSGYADMSIIEEYREAARSLLLGNHNLIHAEEQPWLRNPDEAWPIVADLATTTEAFLILDERLVQGGVLQVPSDRTRPQHETQRLVASNAARVARWYSTTDAVDLATAAAPSETTTEIGPVRIVNQAADLSTAQRRLGSYLRPLNGASVFRGQDVTLDSGTFGMVVTNQKFLCERLAVTAVNSHDPASVQVFTERADLLGDVLVKLARTPLVNADNRGRNERALWQQTELTRWLRKNPVPVLEGRQVRDLAEATAETLTNLGKCARLELTRPGGMLRSTRRDDNETNFHPLGHKHSLVQSLRALIEAAPPLRSSNAGWAGARHSEALRRMLDATPPETGTRPRPYVHVSRVQRPADGPAR